MKAYAFTQVDVFTGVALKGNPLAVVHGAADLSDAQMKAFANWTNLSETTFLLPPTDPAADYRVRIFTPHTELTFAGHPTLGSCHAWLEAGGKPRHAGRVVQQCGVGLVDVVSRGEGLAFAAPPSERLPVGEGSLQRALAAFGLARDELVSARWLRNGSNWWCSLLLKDAQRVIGLRPDAGALTALANVEAGPGEDRPQRQWGLVAPHAGASGDVHLEVRALIAAGAFYEDPVTGSLNAAMGQWLMEEGHAPSRYRVTQGTVLGRDGQVTLEKDGDRLWVGGRSVSCVRGQLVL
jgi:PhzF family phenazine biosynthesis protein